MSAAGVGRWQLHADAHGWRAEGAGVAGWSIVPSTDPGGGFVLFDAASIELGRTCRLPGAEPGSGEAVLVLGNGQLFRAVLRGPEDGRLELVGWETPGPYLVARPASGAWTLVATAAGTQILPNEPMLMLFAAEVLAAAERGPSRPDGGDA